jgi:chromosome segregation ATPase
VHQPSGVPTNVVAMAFPVFGPPTREAVDAELARLGADAARISEALLALADNSGYKLLDSAPLTGVTAERWQRASSRIAALWDNYTAYQDVLNRAAEIRGRRPKPRTEELQAIADLLRGKSITLSSKAVALSERTLLGPSVVTETATLAETLSRMENDYQIAADFVAAAESAWNRLFQQADPVQERLKQVIADVRGLDDRTLAAAVAGVGDSYTALRREIFADPIGLSAPRSDFPARLARIREDLEAVAASVSGAADLRADFERRAQQLSRLIDRIDEVEEAQRAAEAHVREKILVGDLPARTHQAAALRARLAALSDLRERGLWRRLAEEAAALEGAIDAALAVANRTHQALAGLLERREELRGRLAAYRVRAARFGASEDTTLEAYYQAAREQLWSQPCDLAASTKALAAYQKAVLALDEIGGRGGVGA